MGFRNVVMGIGILIVYALALFQGIEAFFPGPEYEDYCGARVPRPIALDGRDCVFSQELETKAQTCYNIKGEFVYEYDSNGCPIEGVCDECRIDYEKDLDDYSNQIFIYMMILGFFVLVIGLVFLKKEPVGSALIASGIYTVFYGVVVNWRNFGNSWRFLLLFALLVILIWIGLRLESAGKKKGFKFRFWKK